MVIDDAGLSRFALGVAPAAGVMLAVLVSILMFQLARISISERDSTDRIRTTADKMYELLRSQRQLSITYFERVKNFEGFTHQITVLSRVYKTELIPDYISWRTETVDVLRTVALNMNRMNSTGDIPADEYKFHAEFLDLMDELDAGIQYNHASVIIARRVAVVVKVATGIAAGILLISILIALAAELRYGSGFSDYLNFTWAFVLIILILSLACLFGVLVFVVGTSSSKEIEAAAERHIRKLQNIKKPSPLARVWLLIRRSKP